MSAGKIIIADDLKLTLDMVKSALSATGCTVLTALDGVSAIELIKKEQPDLVIMDLMMPDMNGDECCKLIREDPLINRIPIILSSSRNRIDGLDESSLKLFDGTLTKPFTKSLLIETVQKYLDIICRNEKRRRLDTEVVFKYEDNIYSGHMLNISVSGMFIISSDILDMGSQIDIAVIDKKKGILEFVGEVIRVIKETSEKKSGYNGPGMGIKFLGDDETIKNTVNRLTNN